MHDGTLDADLRPLNGGEFVFGVASKGPFLGVCQVGENVEIRDLTTDRTVVESRPNVKPIILGLDS